MTMYFDINSVYAKVDFSPMAVEYLDMIIERSSPDSFNEFERNAAIKIANEFGDMPYDGRYGYIDDDD